MRQRKRIAAFALAAMTVFSTLPTNALAVENPNQNIGGLCEHHTKHTAGCGYVPATEDTLCTHQHGDDCYTFVTECVHKHTSECFPAEGASDNTATPAEPGEAEPTNCVHVCSEKSGCVKQVLDCPHERGEHGETCGCTSAPAEKACNFVCDICSTQRGDNAGQTPDGGTLLMQGGRLFRTATDSQPVYSSEVTVEFSKDGQNITTVPYGSTIIITATIEKTENAADTLRANIGTVNFYLGTVENGTKLNPGGVAVTQGSNGTCTATLEVKLEGELWHPRDNPYTITADFSGYAPGEDQGGDGLAPSTGSAQLTVTDSVIGDTDLSRADVKVNGEYVYTGQPIIPDVTVKVNGNTLEKGKHYTVTVDNNTNAGSAVVTVAAIGNSGYTGSRKVPFTIKPAPLTITNAAIAGKTYDGSTNAVVQSVTFDKALTTLNSNQDYSVSGKFIDPNAGDNKSVVVTVSLLGKAALNYALQNNTFQLTGQTIHRGTGTPKSGSMLVANGLQAIYSYDLSQLLPTLPDGQDFGSVTYTIGSVVLGSYYTNGAAVQDGVLTLPIQAVSGQEGDIGTVTIQIETDNFTLPDAVIRVAARNKQVPQGEPTLTPSRLTYGQPLSSIALSGNMTDPDGKTVTGQFTWDAPDTLFNAGSHNALYTFTPNDSNAYVAVTGSVEVMVDRAVPTGQPTYQTISATDKTLADAKLTAAFNVPGTVRWNLPDTTPVAANTAYEWIFTPDDDQNYESLSGDIVLWTASTPLPPSGGGSSSGGSSSNNKEDDSDAAIVKRPNADGSNTPTTAQSEKVKADNKGNVIIAQPIVAAIDKAKADAKKHGNQKNGIAIEVPVEIGNKLDGVQITLKADSLKKLTDSTVKRLTIDTDSMIDFGFTLDTLKELNRQTSSDIVLKVKKTAVASAEAKAAIGTRPAYDISLWEVKNDTENPLTGLNEKAVSIAIPYTPAKGEQPGSLYAVYVDGNDKPQWITKSSYDADRKTVIFELPQPGVYSVGYDAKVTVFTDITDHWAKDNILFAASRGILNGISETTFSPDTGMTRGMFVTALGRLAGVNADSYQTGNFIDVEADAYYAPYVNWAAKTGIVSGMTDTTFAPDSQINREQMAVIMQDYAVKLSCSIPKTLETATFADNESISSWAKESVKSMQQTGILAGKTNNQFDPKGTATRAEAATVLRRFVEIVIDPQTANGWQQNDSGEWNYYKNGEPMKGWLSDDQKWYWLDQSAGKMFTGGWKQIDGKQYYFYADGSMAVNTKVDGYAVGADGARLK